MAKLLRKVKRQNRWFKAGAQPLLDIGDVPADPLGDLTTSENKLSVYRVDGDVPEIERIARALALSGQHLDNVGYVIFDASLLEQLSVGLDPIDGKTDDNVVNKWHVDLTNLTGTKLVALTRLILLEGISDIILKKRIVELVEQGLSSNELPEKVRAKLPKSHS
jgi:hypothetical protein